MSLVHAIQHLSNALGVPADGTTEHKKLVPHFTLASADEHKGKTAVDVAKVAGVPAWRVVLGNIAAGATAGCAVEAGITFISAPNTFLHKPESDIQFSYAPPCEHISMTLQCSFVPH